MQQTHAQQLADMLLDPDDLEHFVRDRRAKRRPWRLIARDLYERTNLDLTHETLRNWYPDEVEAEAS